MNSRKLIEDDIKKIINKSLKLGVLVNPRISGDFYNNESKISSKYASFSDQNDYLSRYYKQYESGEFLIAFNDGGFLQINYEFKIISKNKSHISKMNLCYLPPVKDGRIVNEYIRVDYNDSKDNTFFHAYAHMHIGFNNIRIPLKDVLFLTDFLRIVLYLFYPNDFKIVFNDYSTGNTIQSNSNDCLTKIFLPTKEVQENMYLYF